jgi:S1-C subfamily serine protease
MTETPSNKFITFVAIIATPFALGAFLLAWGPAQQFSNSDPRKDGYVQPRSISDLVDRTQASTVTVFCEPTKKDGVLGTAWAIDLPNGVEKEYPTTLITNHHVIEKCIGLDGSLTVALLNKDEVKARIVKWDKENDLAVLAADLEIEPLELSEFDPWPGYWTMALGSADGYEGSVAFGSILNATDFELLLTTNLSHGNSGGPLVDNEGRVIGVVTWSSKTEQYNGAMSLNAMCAEILECDGKYYWKRDN